MTETVMNDAVPINAMTTLAAIEFSRVMKKTRKEMIENQMISYLDIFDLCGYCMLFEIV
jgi:hypothetical protein